MPRLALTLGILWFLSLVVFRSIVQWKRTGSTGFKGSHGAFGSPPWIAGASLALGLLAAPLALLATLFGWPAGTLFAHHTPLHLLGAALTLAGTAGALVAQLGMGNSWRIGVDESETTQLVTTGLFAWVRNPIFSFLILSMLGFVLLIPCVLSLLAGFLTLLGIETQVRAVEEPYLQDTHGEAYARYAASVGRFVPGFGRLRNDRQ